MRMRVRHHTVLGVQRLVLLFEVSDVPAYGLLNGKTIFHGSLLLEESDANTREWISLTILVGGGCVGDHFR
jgi:hypothetical protein